MTEKTLLAIDPGSAKCGMALVTRDHNGQIQIVWRKICEASQMIDQILVAKSVRPFELVVIGNGTSSAKAVRKIREDAVGMAVLVVDEKNTTLQARERYWTNTKRRGWRRLLPATLQVPPEPIDDFAALILAERVLNSA